MSSRLNYHVRIGIALLIGLLVVVIIAYLPPKAQAQDGQTLQWGELTLGQMVGTEAVLYRFQGNVGETITLEVNGISGFLPTITLLDANRSIVSQNLNAGQTSRLTLSFTLFSGDFYYAQIGEVSNGAGQFTVLLERVLPPGIPLVNGILTTGAVAPNLTTVFYDFMLAPTSNTRLDVRSITAGYSPQVSVVDANGTVIAEVNSTRLVGASLEFGPSDEGLKLMVSLGEFDTQASYEIELAYTTGQTLPTTSGPDATPEIGLCTITSARSDGVNIRSGGSTNHASVGFLRNRDSAIGIGFNSANGGWYQIRLSDGVVGWVASFVVNAEGECDSLPIVAFGVASIGTQEPDDDGPHSTPKHDDDDDDDD